MQGVFHTLFNSCSHRPSSVTVDLTILDSERSARIERRTIIIRISRIAVFHLVCALCLTGFSIKSAIIKVDFVDFRIDADRPREITVIILIPYAEAERAVFRRIVGGFRALVERVVHSGA